jgi:hypothetical protein
MKITGPQGPGGGAPPVADETIDKAGKAGAPRFDEVLGAPPSQAADAVAQPGADAISAIGARLRAGEISGAQATELLLDAVVRARVSDAAPRLRAELRETLRRLMHEDPTLAAKVRRLAGDDK